MTDLAVRLIAAVAAYDADALGALLAPSFRRWLNLTDEEQGADALLAMTQLERAAVADSTVEVRSNVSTSEGFVLQLVVAGVTTRGAAFRIPVCLVVTVTGDLIARIDEYADSATIGPLLDALTPMAPKPV